MQYTIRNVPAHLDRALRQRAREQGRSLNDVALEALLQALGLNADSAPRRDLSDIAGTWKEDPDTAAALKHQRRIDKDLWR
jgi:plasmid stability protein